MNTCVEEGETVIESFEEKWCSGCNEHHPIEEFGKRKSSSDGYETQCKKYLSARKRVRNKLKNENIEVTEEQLSRLVTVELNKIQNISPIDNEKLCHICGEYFLESEMNSKFCLKCYDNENHPLVKFEKYPNLFIEITNKELEEIYKTAKNLANKVVIHCHEDVEKEQFELHIFDKISETKRNDLFWYKNYRLNDVCLKAKEFLRTLKYNPNTWDNNGGFAAFENYDLINARYIS